MTIPLPFTAGAGELLAAMRPHVEHVLNKYKDIDDIPQCPSQSLRAMRTVDHINKQMSTTNHSDLNVRMELIKDREKLEKFLAVHTTVVMLEWVERNESFQF